MAYIMTELQPCVCMCVCVVLFTLQRFLKRKKVMERKCFLSKLMTNGIFVVILETGFQCIDQAGLELQRSAYLSSAEVKGLF